MAGKKTFQRSEVLAKARQRLGLDIIPGQQDRAGLLALTQLLYSDLDIRDPRYIAWQYEQNPNGPAYDRLGRVQGKIVGQYAAIPVQFQLSSGLAKGSLSVNTMTHPDYRGQGLFMLLAEAVYQASTADGAKLTLGFPNPNSYKGFLKHLDFKDIGSLPLWIMPLNLSALAIAEKAKALAPLIKLAAPFWRFGLNILGVNTPPTQTLEPTRTIDDRFTAFWESVKGGYKNLVARDARHLQWRFIAHPTRQYSVVAATSGKNILGYIVTRKTTIQGVPCGMIVDLLVAATPAGGAVARDLIRSAVREFQTAGLGIVGCLAPAGSVTATALRRCGFWPCPERLLPQPFPVIVRWNTPDAAPTDIWDLKNWYLTMGDYDAI